MVTRLVASGTARWCAWLLGVFAACQPDRGGGEEAAPSLAAAQAAEKPTPKVAPVLVDGSSTVLPISKAILALYAPRLVTDIKIASSGTGGGFKKFCKQETDINGASRPISATEIKFCTDNGVRFIELPVAFDGVAVVVPKGDDFLKSITVSDLKRLWETTAESSLLNWNDLRPSLPKQKIHLAGPGLESGTFDFFTLAIVGSEHASRSDYKASEDDQELVDFVASTPGSLGYFGLAYYIKNQESLRAVAIDDERPDNGKGPIEPSAQTVADGTYQPLSRPVFIYVNRERADRPQVRDFVAFYLRATRLVAPDVGYVGLPASALKLAEGRFEQRKVGTMFDGTTSVGLTIEELLSAETVAAEANPPSPAASAPSP